VQAYYKVITSRKMNRNTSSSYHGDDMSWISAADQSATIKTLNSSSEATLGFVSTERKAGQQKVE
jgi:hypothetical protein